MNLFVNSNVINWLQPVSLTATVLFIVLLVWFELTPALKRRRSLKLFVSGFVSLGALVVAGAVARGH